MKDTVKDWSYAKTQALYFEELRPKFSSYSPLPHTSPLNHHHGPTTTFLLSHYKNGEKHINEYCILLKIRGMDQNEARSDSSFVGEGNLDGSDIIEI